MLPERNPAVFILQSDSIMSCSGMRNSLPVIYVKGSHYEVGYEIGRTFSGLIENLLANHGRLNEAYLPLYETPAGKEVYSETLEAVSNTFPKYIRELKGTADGANVPFHKLFLLHMDEILPNAVEGLNSNGTNGCSTVCCNHPNQELLGHTEDALSETLGHIYIVNAHITESKPHEVFSSLCYAGYLPGFCMSYNMHGLAFSVNIIQAKHLVKGKIPRSFLTRALLSADSLVKVESILRDPKCSAGDAVSLNMTFLKQEGDRLFHNIEVAPAVPPAQESTLSALTVSPGEHIIHCNKFLRLETPEAGGPIIESSDARHAAGCQLVCVNHLNHVIYFLGDQSNAKHPVFRDSDGGMIKTVAVGVFDCVARTWSIYLENPKTSDPIAVLPISLL